MSCIPSYDFVPPDNISSAVSEYCVFSVSPDLEVCFSDRLKTIQQLTYINSFLEKFQYAKKKVFTPMQVLMGLDFVLNIFCS